MRQEDNKRWSVQAALKAVGAEISSLLRDESGLTTIEYTTMGGVLSGVIAVAGSALRDAQAAAVDSMVQPD
ncbi:Flp family type IVb pilin [Phenylobacterium aquaticum]|uniref:Flp family type IVb pilin n=1 Tax=Phenylobacterium aquaticum TaxID=1763816 RepID=UPI001F5D506E|nr:hypothetical protein [Phenylobacterium aquaticum]MCI3132705.1 hypothetical protein [Phenylobacterium aquaticum]